MPSDETITNPLNPRRRRISSGSFSAGSIASKQVTQGVLNTKLIKSINIIGERSNVNARKISIIKNILGYQKSELKENLSAISPQALMLRNLDEILKAIRDEDKQEKKDSEYERKKRENEKRRLRETKLEERFKKLKQVVAGVISPVKKILDGIVKAFIALVAGKFFIKLLNYLTDPKNQKKIESVTKFLSNNAPKLFAAYVLFGTLFGRSVRKLASFLIKGSLRLAGAGALLLKRLGLKGAGRLARTFLGPKGKLISFGIEALATVGAFKAIEGLVSSLRGGGEEKAFSGGGLVDGPYGNDRVNARLTDGEFVMSAPAVAAIGPAVLENINEKYGGSNKPRMVSGTLMAQEGGMVNRERATQAGMFSTRIGRGVLDNIGYGSGDFMFKGLPAGVEYNPAFSGAGDKLFGLNPQGKKLTDLFGLRGAFGELADTQYFSPDLGTAMKYAGEGGSVVSMPRTSGFSSFKNPLGSNVMRGFDPSKGIEQLVRTSDSVASAAAGTTRVMNMNNPALQKMAMQGLRAGAPLARRLGRFIPFAGAGLAAADVADRTARGDNLGAALGGISAIPGPVGMVGAGAQMVYDASRYQGGPIRGRSGAKRAMMARQTPSVVIPEPPMRRTPQVVMMDGGTEMIGAEPSARPSTPTLPNIPICPQSANKADVCGYTRIR
ncbi:hypothetical protein CMO86_06780 [Candidatus Woesearchaeota archaeon]|nr:hypothetical protein [Candidatus Woesearchaeota archaeon]